MPKTGTTKFIPSYLTEDSLCVVCQQKASGKHYGAIACEGCKGFFRRTVQHARQDKYVCIEGNDSCALAMFTKSTKSDRYCQRCRFAKCISAGFQTEKVLDTFRRTAQNELREENRIKRRRAALLRVSPADDSRRADDEPTRQSDAESTVDDMVAQLRLTCDGPTSTRNSGTGGSVDCSGDDGTRLSCDGAQRTERFEVAHTKESTLVALSTVFRMCLIRDRHSVAINGDAQVQQSSPQVLMNESFTLAVLSQVVLPTIRRAREYVRLIARDVFDVDEADAKLLERETVWELVTLIFSARCDFVASDLINQFERHQASSDVNTRMPPSPLTTLLSTVINYGRVLSEWNLDELTLSLTSAIVVFCTGKMIHLDFSNLNKLSETRAELCALVTEHLRIKLQIVNRFELGPYFRLINELTHLARSFGEMACELMESHSVVVPRDILPQLLHPFKRKRSAR